jgi:hypothetical protein
MRTEVGDRACAFGKFANLKPKYVSGANWYLFYQCIQVIIKAI